MIEARKSAEYIRNTEMVTFFGQTMRKGSFAKIEEGQSIHRYLASFLLIHMVKYGSETQ